MRVLSDDEISTILSAVGLRVDFTDKGFRGLDAELQAVVREAEARYREIVGHQRDDMKRAAWSFMGHEPGCKSALFRGLLSGRQPFPVPPPTSNSYPWYDLLDQPGPRRVSLGGMSTLGSHFAASRAFAGDQGSQFLGVNQGCWRVDHSNDDAKRCLEAWTSKGPNSAEALEAGRRAEWAVGHPGAPAHRTYWGSDLKVQTGEVSDIQPSLAVGEFVVLRVVQPVEGLVAEEIEEREKVLAEVGEDKPGIRRLVRECRRQAYAAPDWTPSARGPRVEYHLHGWMIAPVAISGEVPA